MATDQNTADSLRKLDKLLGEILGTTGEIQADEVVAATHLKDAGRHLLMAALHIHIRQERQRALEIERHVADRKADPAATVVTLENQSKLCQQQIDSLLARMHQFQENADV